MKTADFWSSCCASAFEPSMLAVTPEDLLLHGEESTFVSCIGSLRMPSLGSLLSDSLTLWQPWGF